MSKLKKNPRTILQTLMTEYQLNPFLLSQMTNLNYQTIRNIMLNRSRVSVKTALHLAKYFGQAPDYWLDLQKAVDLEEAAANKKLQKDLSKIKKVEKPSARQTQKRSASKAGK